jgi:type IX secretion system PorP/SprF family membrane protein
MKKYLIYILLISSWVSAQQDAYFSLMEYQMTLVNPAYAGAEGNQILSIHSRNQWSNTEDNPKTLSMAYSVARKKNIGLGISVISDQVFVEKQTFVAVDFSYKLKLNEDASMYLGLKGGVNSFRSDTSNLTSYSPQTDPAKKMTSRLLPNLGVGFLYQHKTHWISAAIPRLFNSKEDEEVVLNPREKIHFYFGAGAKLSITSDVALEPAISMRSTEGVGAITEGVLWGNYQNKFRFGVGFRTASVLSLKVNLLLSDTFSLSYAYDSYGESNLSAIQLNAHEIGLQIRFPSKNSTPDSAIEETVNGE